MRFLAGPKPLIIADLGYLPLAEHVGDSRFHGGALYASTPPPQGPRRRGPVHLRVHGRPLRPRVGWPEGVSPPGSHRTERDSLPSLRSCHSDHQKHGVHAQWAKSLGCRAGDALPAPVGCLERPKSLVLLADQHQRRTRPAPVQPRTGNPSSSPSFSRSSKEKQPARCSPTSLHCLCLDLTRSSSRWWWPSGRHAEASATSRARTWPHCGWATPVKP